MFRDNWDAAIETFNALGTHEEWAQVEQNLRDAAKFFRDQRSIHPHLVHVVRSAARGARANHPDLAQIQADLEGPQASFATVEAMHDYFRGRLSRLTSVPVENYADWKLPTILALLARILSDGAAPSSRMRFVEWWCERIDLLVDVGIVRTPTEAARLHREQALSLAQTAEGWAEHVLHARAGGASEWEPVPPFFWHALRAEFAAPRKTSVSYWTAVRFNFYAGDYGGAHGAATVMWASSSVRTFERVHVLIDYVLSACESIRARRTHVPEPHDRQEFARLVWLRQCGMAKWARGDFSSISEFVRWQTSMK